LDTFTVSFFGHRYIDDFNMAESKMERIVQDLLVTKEYVEFLVGRDGEFDQIVSSVIKRAKRSIRDYNSSLIWVLPYPTAEFQNNEKDYDNYYDEIEICESSSMAHPKGAIQIRNKEMIDRSDLVVCYIDHESGGAYQSIKYAIKQGKTVINIAKEGAINW